MRLALAWEQEALLLQGWIEPLLSLFGNRALNAAEQAHEAEPALQENDTLAPPRMKASNMVSSSLHENVFPL